jgi:hypothetical protein
VLHKPEHARAAFKAAEEKLAATPQGRHVGILTRAMHHRNALWLAQRFELAEPAARAREFFKDHLLKGFAVFQNELGRKG